jgi:hypothetical protein
VKVGQIMGAAAACTGEKKWLTTMICSTQDALFHKRFAARWLGPEDVDASTMRRLLLRRSVVKIWPLRPITGMPP